MRPVGYVEQLKSGRWVARVPIDGERKYLPGSHATRDEAERARRAFVEEVGLDGIERDTVASLAPAWFDRREATGMRSIDDQRSIWRTHVESAEWYDRPLRSLSRAAIRDWLASVKGAQQTRQNALNTLRVFLADCLERGKIRENPARDIRLPRVPRVRDTWSYLDEPELDSLLDCAQIHERLAMRFAVGTGLRAGEQAALRLCDVHLDRDPHVVVRYGGPPNEPTKSGRPRVVPLFGLGLDSAREWIEMLPRWIGKRIDGASKNEHALLWPSQRGDFRVVGRMLGRIRGGHDDDLGREIYVDRFEVLCYQAGLFDRDPKRALVWHSLRHTCASWLVSGWQGRRWSLEEVKGLLGHESITTTERYAHLASSALFDAARATPEKTRRSGR